jgi:hypothetical protein
VATWWFTKGDGPLVLIVAIVCSWVSGVIPMVDSGSLCLEWSVWGPSGKVGNGSLSTVVRGSTDLWYSWVLWANGGRAKSRRHSPCLGCGRLGATQGGLARTGAYAQWHKEEGCARVEGGRQWVFGYRFEFLPPFQFEDSLFEFRNIISWFRC